MNAPQSSIAREADAILVIQAVPEICVAVGTSDHCYLRIPAVGSVPAIFAQLLAYFVSVERGTDVDQPRNLSKSVTVE